MYFHCYNKQSDDVDFDNGISTLDKDHFVHAYKKLLKAGKLIKCTGDAKYKTIGVHAECDGWYPFHTQGDKYILRKKYVLIMSNVSKIMEKFNISENNIYITERYKNKERPKIYNKIPSDITIFNKNGDRVFVCKVASSGKGGGCEEVNNLSYAIRKSFDCSVSYNSYSIEPIVNIVNILEIPIWAVLGDNNNAKYYKYKNTELSLDECKFIIKNRSL